MKKKNVRRIRRECRELIARFLCDMAFDEDSKDNVLAAKALYDAANRIRDEPNLIAKSPDGTPHDTYLKRIPETGEPHPPPRCFTDAGARVLSMRLVRKKKAQ